VKVIAISWRIQWYFVVWSQHHSEWILLTLIVPPTIDMSKFQQFIQEQFAMHSFSLFLYCFDFFRTITGFERLFIEVSPFFYNGEFLKGKRQDQCGYVWYNKVEDKQIPLTADDSMLLTSGKGSAPNSPLYFTSLLGNSNKLCDAPLAGAISYDGSQIISGELCEMGNIRMYICHPTCKVTP
jgi:hypothetical protein